MSRPAVARTPAQLHELHQGRPAVLVPTMGALHAGHLALIELARRRAAGDMAVCVSIFLNPLQFAPHEDLDSYPRQLEQDLDKLAGLSDTCYAPSAKQMYPRPQEIVVHAPRLGAVLCGRARPEHFAGVLTVVLKLLAQTRAAGAVFGRKDYQQLQLIRLMAEQLHLPVEILSAPVIREPDLLACSSRNAKLDAAQRRRAPQLYASLQAAAGAIAGGAAAPEACAAARRTLAQAGFAVDYVECRDRSLGATPDLDDPELAVLGAASLGGVRLIDNVLVNA